MQRSVRHKAWKMVVLAAPLFALAAPAKPHTHVDPDGQQVSWYPRECCHEGDCRPVVSITPDSQGLWMTLMDGYTVFVAPRDNRRPSLDTRWHVCVGVDDVDNITPKITCIFEPGNVKAASLARKALAFAEGVSQATHRVLRAQS